MGLRREVARAVGKAWLSAFGWRVDGPAPAVKKAVVVAAPHTSNWDFPFTIATSWALGLEMSWMGKHTLFRPPFGHVMRWLGGIPVNRHKRHNAVKSAVEVLEIHEELFLVLAPEGTRSKSKWKTGFYNIAVGAKAPIVLGYLDYEKKTSGLGVLFYPTGNIDEDMLQIKKFYANVTGKHPERTSVIELTAKASPTTSAR